MGVNTQQEEDVTRLQQASQRKDEVTLRVQALETNIPQITGFEDDDTKHLILANRYLRKARIPTLKPVLPLLLQLKGKPYTLQNYFPFEPFFRTRMARTTLLKTGRQVSKSTSLAAQGVVFSNSIPYFSTLYITPLFEMVRRFSHQYVREFIERSPVKRLFMGKKTMNSVLQRSFLNGATMFFSYAFLDAERTRGIPADKNCLVADTAIELADGTFSTIADIEPGTAIVSADKNGVITLDKVTEKLFQGVQRVYEVTFEDGQKIRCTADERFLSEHGCWKHLSEFFTALPTTVGHMVERVSDTDAIRLFIRRYRTSRIRSECSTTRIVSVTYVGELPVWDINTEKYHAFFANGVLVHNCIDEIQDMQYEFLQIIHETLSGSPWSLKQYAGTPKSLDNTIERLWQDSSQAEWVIKCRQPGCGHWNIPSMYWDLLDMIGPWHRDISEKQPGVVCAKCRKALNPRTGHWLHAEKERRWSFAGYHVPQIIMPLHYGNHEKWDILLGKMQGRGNTTMTTFLNEVCGESCDAGSKLVTVTDLKNAAVLPWQNKWEEAVQHLKKYTHRILAVDWGGGGGRVGTSKKDTDKRLRTSFTTLAVLGRTPDRKLDVLWGYRSIKTHDWEWEARLCTEALQKFRCSHIVHDYGGAGTGREVLIRQAGFPYSNIIPIKYHGSASHNIMTFHAATEDHPRDWYSVDKSRSLVTTCMCIKHGLIRFYQYDYRSADDTGLLHDFLALIEEKVTSRIGTDAYYISSNPNASDDFAQAVNIGACALWHMNNDWPNIAEAARFKLPDTVLAHVHPTARVDWDDIS